jgi:hypothetical protein
VALPAVVVVLRKVAVERVVGRKPQTPHVTPIDEMQIKTSRVATT